MFSLLRPAVLLFAALTVLTGVVYPALITGLAQALWPQQANGSLIREGDRILGSRLIGQSFSGPDVFWSRPSATGPMPYNALASSGSNLGPRNPALVDAVKARIETVRAAHPDQAGPVPLDLVTASASGLDPHISLAAARYQAQRVASARKLPLADVEQLIVAHTEAPTWGLLGETRVNVLELNLALAKRSANPAR